jgi:hypothetical protein
METNIHNRSLNHRYVKQVARDIKTNHFNGLNGEPITISKEGTLNNGQHRLSAIIEADMPVKLIMMFGLTRESRMTVDMGRSRSVANYISMEGKSYYNSCAAIASAWMSYSLNRYGHSTKWGETTRQDILQFYHSHQTDVDKAISLFHNRAKQLRCQPTEIATAYCIIKQYNTTHIEGFFEMLIEGSNLDQSDPVLWLRGRLISGSGGKLKVWQKIELILRHWNAWREGKQLKVQIPLRGEFPKKIAG